MRHLPFLFVVTTFWVALSAIAGPRYYVPEIEAPYGATPDEVEAAETAGCGGPQTELNICAWSSYRASQKELQVAVKKLKAALRNNPKEQKVFDQAQDKWLLERNEKCDNEASEYDGGSLVWMVIYNCRKTANESRQAEIGNAIACQERSGCN